MLPSNRPERGGTVREPHDRDDPPSQHLEDAMTRRSGTDNVLLRRSDTADSDRLTRWNTPKDLSEEGQRKTTLPRRAFSGGLETISSGGKDRKWSWVPRVEVPEQLAVTGPRRGERKVSWRDLRLDEEPEPDVDLNSQASLLADRRLSDARRMIEAKKEVRRQRRSLKESGDYLGVQGINPETGKLDILTPSGSDNSTDSQDAELKIKALKLALKNARDTQKTITMASEREAKRLVLKKEKEKLDKGERKKQELTRQSESLKWRRHSKQWSSAQQPELSPIAQSLRSGTPVSSEYSPLCSESTLTNITPGRPSQPIQQTNENATEKAESKLAAAEEQEGHLLLGSPQPEASGTTSQTSGTVIHTPHRRSVIRDKPAALELFENGISFDYAERFSEDKLESGNNNVSKSSPVLLTSRNTNMPGEVDQNPAEFERMPGVKDSLSTRANHGSEQSNADSFLEKAAPGDKASWGSIPRPLSTNNLLQPMKGSTPARSFSLSSSKKHRRRLMANQNTGASELGGSQFRKPTQAPADYTMKEDQNPPVSVGTPSHSLSPRQLWSHLKKITSPHIGSALDRSTGEATGQSLSPLTTMNIAQRQPSPKTRVGADSQETQTIPSHQVQLHRISTEYSIREDMDYLKREVAKADQLHWMKEKKQLGPHNVDVQWIEGTIQDIKDRGDEIKDSPACTPTITTTGSDPERSGMSREDILARDGTQNTHMRAARLNCEEQAPSATGSKPATCQTKTKLSSLVKLTPEGQIVPIDITSMDSVVLEQQPKEKHQFLKMLHDHHNKTPKQAEGQHSTSPMSTSTLEQKTTADLDSNRLLGAQAKRHKTHRMRRPKPGTQTPVCSAGPVVVKTANEKRLATSAMQAYPETVWKATLERQEDERLQRLMRTCPGAYPSHLDVVDVTVARFAGPRLNQIGGTAHLLQTPSSGNLWRALLEFLFVVRCHIVVVARLYWGLAGPVFSSSSEYWVRNYAGKATLKDGVAFILAIPGAFAGLLVFM